MSKWFGALFVRSIPRAERMETLKIVFADGFADFDALQSAATSRRKVAGWWVKMFVRHPWMRPMAEWFFNWFYFLK